MEKSRIAILDSFRALAILSVLLYHFFSRWTYPKSAISLYPYDDKYNYFEYGHLGVKFFFIISGFVILFTLENTTSFTVFWKKRLIRLVPPVIAASMFTFIICGYFDTLNIFSSSHKIKNFIPSITFIPPQLISRIIGGNDWGYIDGSYWSLWPELQFYFLSSIIFYHSRKLFLKNFMFTSFIIIVIDASVKFLESRPNDRLLSDMFFMVYERWIDKGFNLVNYMPFFCLGVTLYTLYKNRLNKTKNSRQTNLYTSFLLVFIMTVYGGLHVSLIIKMIYGAMIGVFFLFIYTPKYLQFLENKLLIKIGVSSYFLYLIHQNVGVSLIYYFGEHFSPLDFLAPLLIILSFITISLIYSENFDKKISKWLKSKIINNDSRYKLASNVTS